MTKSIRMKVYLVEVRVEEKREAVENGNEYDSWPRIKHP